MGIDRTSGSADEPENADEQPSGPERQDPPSRPEEPGDPSRPDSRGAVMEGSQKPAEATVESSVSKDGQKPVQGDPREGEQGGESRDDTLRTDYKESDSAPVAADTDHGQGGEREPPDTNTYESPLEQKPSYGSFANLAEEFETRTKSREIAQQYNNTAGDRTSVPGIKRDPASAELDEELIKEQIDPFASDLDKAEGYEESFQRTVKDRGAEWTDGVGGFDVRHHGPGVINEQAKKFDSNETKIAELLAREGSIVEARAEGRIRTADAFVDGSPTEFKAIEGARIPGSTEHELPTDKTVKAALNSAKGQLKNDPAGTRTAILDGRGHGLTHDAAEQGMMAYLGQPHAKGRIDYIRILGDGWEINWP